jgi:hypothetical protein
VNKRGFSAVALLALTCTSCGKGLYPVSGTVTYKGQPAAGAVVFFQRQGSDAQNEHVIMGIVQADGSFTLVCGPHGQGIPPGDYDVLIEWKPTLRRGKDRGKVMPDKLRGRYADRRHPLLHVTIKAGINKLPPFELTD